MGACYWNLLAPERDCTHIDTDAMSAGVQVSKERVASRRYNRPVGTLNVTGIPQVAGKYANPVSALLGLASIGIEYANPETRRIDKWPIQDAIRSDAVLPIAQGSYELRTWRHGAILGIHNQIVVAERLVFSKP